MTRTKTTVRVSKNNHPKKVAVPVCREAAPLAAAPAPPLHPRRRRLPKRKIPKRTSKSLKRMTTQRKKTHFLLSVTVVPGDEWPRPRLPFISFWERIDSKLNETCLRNIAIFSVFLKDWNATNWSPRKEARGGLNCFPRKLDVT